MRGVAVSDLGEMSLWFGLFLSCSSAFTRPSHYLSIAGPCFNAFLLLFVSGVPLLEKSSDNKSEPHTRAHTADSTPHTPQRSRVDVGKCSLTQCLHRLAWATPSWSTDFLSSVCAHTRPCLAVRYGSSAAYQQYKRDTPLLLPNLSALLSDASNSGGEHKRK